MTGRLKTTKDRKEHKRHTGKWRRAVYYDEGPKGYVLNEVRRGILDYDLWYGSFKGFAGVYNSESANLYRCLYGQRKKGKRTNRRFLDYFIRELKAK